ncbi:MAG: DUF6152 family protein [Vicinamibacterales bacterium]
MTRLVTTMAAILALGAVLGAHHSYTAFDRTRTVTITGTVEQVHFANPHVVLRLRVDSAEPVTVSWNSLSQLAYAGVTARMINVGDQLTVTGSPALDPARHEITLIRKVEDRASGWWWEANQVFRSSESGKQD